MYSALMTSLNACSATEMKPNHHLTSVYSQDNEKDCLDHGG